MGFSKDGFGAPSPFGHSHGSAERRHYRPVGSDLQLIAPSKGTVKSLGSEFSTGPLRVGAAWSPDGNRITVIGERPSGGECSSSIQAISYASPLCALDITG